ncbi:MAG: sugar phosphate isomerase/epimerase family protein [Planctomycetota bacterium]
MALPLALQLYSLREDAKEDFFGVLERVAAMGYRGVEFAGLFDNDPAKVAQAVADLGMTAVSAHMGVPTRDSLGETVDTAKALGIDYVVGGGGPPDYADAESIQAIAERFAGAAELLEPHGLRFGIHNHWWEFDHDVDGQCPHDLMMARAGKAFAQVDICWAAFGGHDPAAVIARHAGRVDLLHVKDSSLEKNDEGRPATPHVAVGEGAVDIAASIAAAEQAGTAWAIVELDNCATDMEEAVRKSAAYLMSHDLAEGNPPSCGCCGG